jgi:nucleotide-binding universal stress UspA family protein
MMIKDILVHVDATPAAGRRLDLALSLAERTEAHVVGLYVDSFEQMLMYSDVYAVASLMEVVAEEAAREGAAAEARFQEEIAGRAVTTEWRAVKGLTDRKIAEHARYADLVVVGQNDPEEPATGSAARVPEVVPLTSGKPCLVVPHAQGPAGFGDKILVAWDGSREASRAVADAMPLLRAAGRVTIAQIKAPTGDPFASSLDLTAFAAHLARHGIDLETRTEAAEGRSVAQSLLALAGELSADLIVMGAYGHARLRELILGGVTSEILTRMTLPVLMSH